MGRIGQFARKDIQENSYTSATIEVSDEQKVISSGPYSVVRHPMSAGAFLLLLFIPLALGSWVATPLPIPLILFIVVRLLEEEKLLSSNLIGYESYRRKVHYRLLPFIWLSNRQLISWSSDVSAEKPSTVKDRKNFAVLQELVEYGTANRPSGHT